jgi:DNA-binding XRE family transcriptional regulator
MRGYSQIIIETNQKATETVGTLLGALCISLKYPVSQVAKELNVSRQTVYDWFSGKTKPSKQVEHKVSALINKINKK